MFYLTKRNVFSLKLNITSNIEGFEGKLLECVVNLLYAFYLLSYFVDEMSSRKLF